MKLDILAIGVHPDDVELGCSGTLISQVKKGKKAGIIDLTKGELGTRGSVQIRKKEAAAAAKIINVAVRENLGFKDGFFKNDEAHQRKIISALRKYQPDIVLCNAPEDRHPDHGRSAALVVEAAFLSGLRKIETSLKGIKQQPWRPAYVFHYIQDRELEPDFIMDISGEFEQKLASIKAYTTQFYDPANKSNEPQTYISSSTFMDAVKGKAVLWGKQIGTEFGEGFITSKKLGLSDFQSIILKNT